MHVPHGADLPGPSAQKHEPHITQACTFETAPVAANKFHCGIQLHTHPSSEQPFQACFTAHLLQLAHLVFKLKGTSGFDHKWLRHVAAAPKLPPNIARRGVNQCCTLCACQGCQQDNTLAFADSQHAWNCRQPRNQCGRTHI